MTSLSCTAARELMLTAGPDQLHPGAGSSPLSRHLQECPACARAARAICAEHDALNDALAALVRDAGPAPAVRQARRRSAAWRIPAAAAAAAALLLVGRTVVRRDPAPAPLPVRAAAVPRMPIVSASADRAVAIMQTSNPNITVVWQLENMQ